MFPPTYARRVAARLCLSRKDREPRCQVTESESRESIGQRQTFATPFRFPGHRQFEASHVPLSCMYFKCHLWRSNLELEPMVVHIPPCPKSPSQFHSVAPNFQIKPLTTRFLGSINHRLLNCSLKTFTTCCPARIRVTSTTHPIIPTEANDQFAHTLNTYLIICQQIGLDGRRSGSKEVVQNYPW